MALRAHMKKAVDDSVDMSAAVKSFDARPYTRLQNAAELMPGNTGPALTSSSSANDPPAQTLPCSLNLSREISHGHQGTRHRLRELRTTIALIEQMAQAKGVAINLQKVQELRDIMSYGVMSTPGVVIDGKVVHAGGVQSADKIERWLATGNVRLKRTGP